MVDVLPLFPLGTVLFPGLLLPLQVFEPRYRELMRDLMEQPRPWTFGVVAIREGHEVGADSVKSLYGVGCIAVVEQVEQRPDGRIAIVLVGGRRFRVLDLDESRPYLQARVEFIDEPTSHEVQAQLAMTVRERFAAYCSGLGATGVVVPDDADALSYVIAATMLIPLADRQALLEAPDTGQRLQAEASLLSRELALIRAGSMPASQPRLPPHSQN